MNKEADTCHRFVALQRLAEDHGFVLRVLQQEAEEFDGTQIREAGPVFALYSFRHGKILAIDLEDVESFIKSSGGA